MAINPNTIDSQVMTETPGHRDLSREKLADTRRIPFGQTPLPVEMH